MNETVSAIDCPSIVFRLRNVLYTVNSADVDTIMQMPEPEPIPDSPRYVTGMIHHLGIIVPVLDLRILFGMPSLREEYLQFCDMLEARKQDHISWATALEQSIADNSPFTLATDPHKCAFGRWYDSYKSDKSTVNFQLGKIDEPHQLLHKAALDVASCERKHDSCTRSECVNTTMQQVKSQYVPTIVGLLDETKDIMKDSYHEMLLIIAMDGKHFAFVVDEVISVETLEDVSDSSSYACVGGNTSISGVKKSETRDGIILELDYRKLLASITL